MTNRRIMCLILRCLIRANCFFSPSPRWTYAKLFSLCRFAVCQQLRRTKLKPELTMTSASPLFFLFFFPERCFKGQSDQSSLSERKGGRQRQAKKKRMKTPKRTEECANRAVYTNKSSAPQIRSFFFLIRAKFLSDRLNISIDALFPCRHFNFRPPSSSA